MIMKFCRMLSWLLWWICLDSYCPNSGSFGSYQSLDDIISPIWVRLHMSRHVRAHVNPCAFATANSHFHAESIFVPQINRINDLVNRRYGTKIVPAELYCCRNRIHVLYTNNCKGWQKIQDATKTYGNRPKNNLSWVLVGKVSRNRGPCPTCE